jgi:hypothetical protein
MQRAAHAENADMPLLACPGSSIDLYLPECGSMLSAAKGLWSP